MGLTWLLALQAVASPVPPPPPIARFDFDLGQAEPFDPEEVSRLRIWAEACGDAAGDDIIVCGRRDRDAMRYRAGPMLPDPPTALDDLGDALSTNIGPVELGSFRQADGTRGFGLRMKF